MEGLRVGVVGGGQLAWMMGAEAPRLGIKLIVQTPHPSDPAVCRAHNVVLAEIDDPQGTRELAQRCSIITFENEFVDLEALQEIANQEAVSFRPGLTTLAPLLDKYEQRSYLKDIGVSVPKFSLYSTAEVLASDYGFPVVLKARRHGYDGQGTFVLRSWQDLTTLSDSVPLAELLVEEFVPFERELAIIAARSTKGEIAVYPLTETHQENQVCTWTITPARVAAEVETSAKAIASNILEQLQVVGVLGIEFFLTKDQQLLVNEIAPRTHNSGHYTLDGCDTSQFAMQLQAVSGLPLGLTDLKSAGAIMVNLLGYEESNSDYQTKRDRLMSIPHSFVHWYGKASRPGRKLGHVTIILQQLEEAGVIIQEIESIWYER
ncbi:MAG: 5-(carboxyamino)imidazole ribonucleotide synthase [Cyanobacteria bacterium J06621_8]